jgi:lipopolysaccharide assembly outer membrane protein LptD (OstA)
MLKRFGFVAAFVLVAATVALGIHLRWPDDEPPPPPPQLQEELHKAMESATKDSDSVSLALKAITLSQGEGGLEVWRLKASWAGMTQEEGRITVEKPRLTYYMPPDNKELYVTANTGDIDQKNRILRFVGDVVASLNDRSLTGALLVYNGTAKTMTFPDGALFQEPGMTGGAQHVTWHVDDRTVTAEGDVNVLFDRSPAEMPGASEQE